MILAHFIWPPVDFGVGTLIIQAHMEWVFFYLFLSGALNITIRPIKKSDNTCVRYHFNNLSSSQAFGVLFYPSLSLLSREHFLLINYRLILTNLSFEQPTHGFFSLFRNCSLAKLLQIALICCRGLIFNSSDKQSSQYDIELVLINL